MKQIYSKDSKLPVVNSPDSKEGEGESFDINILWGLLKYKGGRLSKKAIIVLIIILLFIVAIFLFFPKVISPKWPF